jgi:hypothetical protein
MDRLLCAFLVTVFVPGLSSMVSADDTEATAILDRAMKALGGEDRLSKIKAATWKGKGKITFGDKGKTVFGDKVECEVTSQTTAQGLDHFRSEIDINTRNLFAEDAEFKRSGVKKEDFDEELKQAGLEDLGKLKILAALNGDKAWFTAMDYPGKPDAAHMKRTMYLEVIPVLLAPLKGPGFKMDVAGEETVGGRGAIILKVTCPDGKDIKISFDNESGLPVKAVGKVFTLQDEEVFQENTYGNYKDFGGIKIATRVEIKNGWLNRKQEIIEFKVLDKVDPSTFIAPKQVDDLK